MATKILIIICILAAGCGKQAKEIAPAVISKEDAIVIACRYVKDKKLARIDESGETLRNEYKSFLTSSLDKNSVYVLDEVTRNEQRYHFIFIISKNTVKEKECLGMSVQSNGEIVTGKDILGDISYKEISEYSRQAIHSEQEAYEYLLKALKSYNSENSYTCDYKKMSPKGWLVRFRLKGFIGSGGWFEILVADNGQVADVIGGK